MQTTAKTLSDVPAINRFLSYCRVRTVPSKTVMIHAGDLPVLRAALEREILAAKDRTSRHATLAMAYAHYSGRQPCEGGSDHH